MVSKDISKLERLCENWWFYHIFLALVLFVCFLIAKKHEELIYFLEDAIACLLTYVSVAA